MPSAETGGPSLLRRTPFRLAVTFAILLIVAFILTGFAIFQQMRTSLNRDLDEFVQSTFAIVADSDPDNDLEDFVTEVNSNAGKAAPDDRIFSLLDPSGTLLAGIALPQQPTDGLHTMNISVAGEGDVQFRVLSGLVGGNRLTIAFSTSEIEELLHVVLTVFGWTSFAVAALAIGGGAWLAARAQRRLDVIASTMNAVSHGRLEARIPLIGNDDDIDQLSRRVNAALDRLSNLVDGVRQVSNDIAHELKTPLNRLQLMVESAIAKPGSNHPELADALDEIGRLNATFEAMLRIARIESGAGKSRFTEVDLAALLSDLFDIYADLAADEDRPFSYAGPKSGVHVFGDRDLLTQLFANLIENAFRHAPAAAPVAISLQREQASVIASVTDAGHGIPEQERSNVLRRLYRLDKSRSSPGAGLGLSIVAAIADLHEASIALDDNAPGLRVTLDFKAYDPLHLSKS